MTQVLELPHLVEQHGMAQVQVRRGRVETGLDPQRAPRLHGSAQPRLQFLALEDLVGAPGDEVESVVQGTRCGHRKISDEWRLPEWDRRREIRYRKVNTALNRVARQKSFAHQ